MNGRTLFSVFAALWLTLSAQGDAPKETRISPPSAELRSRLQLKPFYRKWIDAQGVPTLSSRRVSDFALKEAAFLATQMLVGRDDLRQALQKNRVRLTVMAYDERTTQVPEHADLTPAKYWDRRARGLGATAERPSVSCGEENLLEFEGDPYRGENIMVHEFAHAIHEMALRDVEPDFETRLRQTYQNALTKGLWKETYAATNMAEYWAEGVQSWFDCNQSKNRVHNGVKRREDLEEYDPELARLIAKTFRSNTWRYEAPSKRKSAGHLTGYDPSRSPRFAWEPDLESWYREYIKTHKE